jgi:microcystin-dependent protein
MVDCYVGEIRIFAGNYAPEGWNLCDGTLLQIRDYQALFAVIGKTYGGDGVTNFNLPDLRGRLPVHAGQGASLSSYAIGAHAGTEIVTLTSAQSAAHTHNFMATSLPATSPAPSSGATYASLSPPWTMYIPPTVTPAPSPEFFSQAEIQSAGYGQPHDNMMPGIAMSYIIALNGLYPTQG